MSVETPQTRCCNSVDIHTHIVPQEFPPYAGILRDAPWPSMVAADGCHRNVVISGKVYRSVSHHCWDEFVRIEDMDDTGVRLQVLSPMPELLSYWMSPADGEAISMFLNETIAHHTQRHPTRFAGLGTVPLQDPDLAIRVLDKALHEFGLSGVEIASHVNGVPIGDKRFHDFFRQAENWGASIFVHPLRASTDRIVGPPLLEQVVAFPNEIGMAGMSLMTGGVLRQFPSLKIALSHGGGSLPVQVARIQHAWKQFAAVKELLVEEPTALARRLFVDNLVYDVDLVKQLLNVFGHTQVMVGTDYPFQIMETDPMGRLLALGLSEEGLRQICSDNALRWLGRPGAVG